MKFMKNTALRNTIATLTAGIFAFLFTLSGLTATIDKNAEDILYHRAGSGDSRIRIISIDDRSMNALGDFSDWDRSIYAELVETLCSDSASKPAVIGFDILFTGEGDDEGSVRFAKACADAGNIVCGFSYVFSKELVTDINGNLLVDYLYVQDKIEPYPALRDSVTLGFANALMDNDDGVIRSSFLSYNENGAEKLGFSAAVYKKYTGKAPEYDNSIFPFRYSSGISGYETISLIDVLDGTVPHEVFANSIVLVGAYAAGMMDAYYVPVDKGSQMYGVEIHANVIQALLEGKRLEQFPIIIDALITAVLTCVLVIICSRLKVAGAAVMCAAAAVLRLGAGYLVFNFGYSGTVIVFPIIAVLTAVYFTGLHYYRANRAKRRIEGAFSKYVAPQVVKEIVSDGTYSLKLGGEIRDIAVVFVDIRGFTRLSEKLGPEQVVKILNSYMELGTSCIFKHGGTLDKFIGDAVMAVFNAPFDTDDHVFKAVQAALDMAAGSERLEQEFLEYCGERVGFGIGVNCGTAIVGNIGCEFRMDYTAIGDTVNTAARLEAAAPRGKIYISEEVYKRLDGRIKADLIGNVALKGKSKNVTIYSVTGLTENEE